MYLLESLKSALQNVKSNKMRSFLTMLGIIIGISSVIIIVEIGHGGKQYLTGQFESIGTNVVNLSVSSEKNDIRQSDYFTMDDVKLIKEKIPKVQAVIPTLNGFGSMAVGDKKKNAQITGLTVDYLKLQNFEIVSGRFLNERDTQSQKSIAIIDDTSAMKLYRTTNVVGKKLTVSVGNNNISLTIVGVIKNPAGSLGAAFGDRMPGYVMIPITICDKILASTNMNRMSVTLTDMTDSKDTSSKIVRLLEIEHNTTGKYAAEEGFKQMDTINNALNMFTMVISAIAAISLLVGGIGVMNIMLVSVTERTREIGIRKALGATMKDIRMQFLTESLILCATGGLIGMSLGIGVGFAVGKVLKLDIGVSISVVIISFLFSSAVGIFFGLYPANKAALLDPIEALRYE